MQDINEFVEVTTRAVNWDTGDSTALMFWKQNVQQMWTEDEFKPSRDIGVWNTLSDAERQTYTEVLAGLTGLDTLQGKEANALIGYHEPNLQWGAVYSFMGMMEQVHAKSYSHIFTSLIDRAHTHELIEEWVSNNPYLTKKNTLIATYYRSLLQPKPTERELYMARVASVFLESFLFYSGFYYPLYLAGQGKMVASGEIIRKILLDESIHGVGVGLNAQAQYEKFTSEEQESVKKEMMALFEELYINECEYTASLYDRLGTQNGMNITEDVIRYIQYNANRAMANLGFDEVFNPEDFSSIVENGLDTTTKNHDFFSTKGDGYVLSMNEKDLRDKDFDFSRVQTKSMTEKFLK